jgi:ribosomal protein S12 methylthiotransferase accessory factor
MFPSKLFEKQGDISLQEYGEDIALMRTSGPWKLPLGLGDRAQLMLLALVVKFSWFARALYIRHPFAWSPAYAVLVTFLQKKGLVDTIQEHAVYQGGYFLYRFRKSVVTQDERYIFRGQGIASDRATAFSRGLGEIIERMISGVLDQNRQIVRASAQEMLRNKRRIVYPSRYHSFLPVQLERYRELHRDISHPLTWVWGKNLITQEKTAVPEQMTSWFKYGNTFQDVLAYPTSSGSAGYFSEEGAILRALLEVVERDAFLVHWLTQTPPRVVIRHTLPESIQSILYEFETRGIALFVLDISALLLPAVCIVALNEQSQTPRVIVSAAAEVTFEKAVHQALREMRMLSVKFFEKEEGKESIAWEKMEPFVSDVNRTTRPRYWQGKERVEHIRWFITGESISFDDACQHDQLGDSDDASRLQVCLDVLKKQGKGYYPVVYRPKNSLQEEIGFFVAQVFIPKAFPLYLVEYLGTFESKRLHEFAAMKKRTGWQINPVPHPFS